jgi:virginiamycin B lyase
MITGKKFGTRAVFAGIAAASVACAAPLAARAASCTSAKPTPTLETWTAAKTKVNGAEITIYSAPTDHGAQLQIASGPDKSLWVASVTASAILKLSTKGKATYYPTPTPNAAPESLAAIGNTMFFTEWATPCAGSIAASGKVTEYDTGLSETNSTGMATGPRRNAWFATDYNGIGEITSKGKVEFFSFPDESTQPTAITAGPGGNMWFIENGGPNVGFVTQKGAITEYNTGLGNAYSFGIAAGSDGRMWFADNGNNSIGAITTDGKTVSDYTAGFTGDPISIVAGPDGNLYFGETTPAVGRITPAGVVTEYKFPATEGTFPILSITVGPDGNIWFANNSHAQVGMLKLPKK